MEWKNSVTQLKLSKECLTSRINPVENRLAGLKDKGENLDQINKEYESQTAAEGKCETPGKNKSLGYRHVEEEESQITGIDQIFNKIIKENFPKLSKDIHTGRRSNHITK